LPKRTAGKLRDQPPIDCRETERDERQAGEILRRKGLSEEQAAKKDCDRRHE